MGHTRVRAAAGVVVGGVSPVAAAPGERPRRLLCQPQQQLILHGLLMRQERGGRGKQQAAAERSAPPQPRGIDKGEEASEKPVTGNGGGESGPKGVAEGSGAAWVPRRRDSTPCH